VRVIQFSGAEIFSINEYVDITSSSAAETRICANKLNIISALLELMWCLILHETSNIFSHTLIHFAVLPYNTQAASCSKTNTSWLWSRSHMHGPIRPFVPLIIHNGTCQY